MTAAQEGGSQPRQGYDPWNNCGKGLFADEACDHGSQAADGNAQCEYLPAASDADGGINKLFVIGLTMNRFPFSHGKDS